MNKILCSTGAIIGTSENESYKRLNNIAKNLNCDGYEFMMHRAWYDRVDSLIDELRKVVAPIPVVHCDKHIGEYVGIKEHYDLKLALKLFDINCKIANAVNAEKLVMHLWNGVGSDDNIENNIAAYAEFDKIAKLYKIDLLIENVACGREDPLSHWYKLILEYPDIHFIFDTKMAAFHGQLDLAYSEEYNYLWKNNCIRHLHINDYNGSYMEWSKLKTLPIGSGKIDFERFFQFIKQQEYSGDFTVEATAFDENGQVDFDMLNKCFSFIRSRI